MKDVFLTYKSIKRGQPEVKVIYSTAFYNNWVISLKIRMSNVGFELYVAAQSEFDGAIYSKLCMFQHNIPLRHCMSVLNSLVATDFLSVSDVVF